MHLGEVHGPDEDGIGYLSPSWINIHPLDVQEHGKLYTTAPSAVHVVFVSEIRATISGNIMPCDISQALVPSCERLSRDTKIRKTMFLRSAVSCREFKVFAAPIPPKTNGM